MSRRCPFQHLESLGAKTSINGPLYTSYTKGGREGYMHLEDEFQGDFHAFFKVDGFTSLAKDSRRA